MFRSEGGYIPDGVVNHDPTVRWCVMVSDLACRDELRELHLGIYGLQDTRHDKQSQRGHIPIDQKGYVDFYLRQ